MRFQVKCAIILQCETITEERTSDKMKKNHLTFGSGKTKEKARQSDLLIKYAFFG